LRCFAYVAPVRDREECWRVWRYEQPAEIVRDPHARYEGLGIINHDSVTLNTLDDVFTLLEIWRVDTSRLRENWKLTEQLNKEAGE
jgi:hypothetical protein